MGGHIDGQKHQQGFRHLLEMMQFFLPFFIFGEGRAADEGEFSVDARYRGRHGGKLGVFSIGADFE